MAQVALYPGINSQVVAGGTSVIVAYPFNLGGFIVNPYSNTDQGLVNLEVLFVDPTGPAAMFETTTTVAVYPGSVYNIPANSSSSVWVNSASSGHKFTSVFFAPPIQYPPTPLTGAFPPNAPTTQVEIIPSYLYQEYSDDDDLQAFVASFNSLAQTFLNTINDLNLPIYTDTNISGPLLDWVAEGLYGMVRPPLTSGRVYSIGPFNTYEFNVLNFNDLKKISKLISVYTSDDIFKRILTWHFFKGDGKTFNVRWLKRRIMRFINGVNGTAPDIDNTYQVSVSFGLNYQINITLVTGFRKLTGGALFNRFLLNTKPFNGYLTSFTAIPPLNSAALVEAMNSGILELPFQFTYIITT